MRAVICSAFTGPQDLRVGEIAEPAPAADEILIDRVLPLEQVKEAMQAVSDRVVQGRIVLKVR